MDEDRGAALVGLARQSIVAAFENRRVDVPGHAWLRERRAAFVSLHERHSHALRGCIGTLDAAEPLGQAVVSAAVGAAFRDPRFEPLVVSELTRVRVEISVLSPMRRIEVANEAEAIGVIARDRLGVLLEAGASCGVFLPKVWESLDDPETFLRQLKRKAGLPPAFWSSTIALSIFTCDEFAETP